MELVWLFLYLSYPFNIHRLSNYDHCFYSWCLLTQFWFIWFDICQFCSFQSISFRLLWFFSTAFFFHFYFICSLSDLEFSSYLLSLALISYFFPLASNSESWKFGCSLFLPWAFGAIISSLQPHSTACHALF